METVLGLKVKPASYKMAAPRTLIETFSDWHLCPYPGTTALGAT